MMLAAKLSGMLGFIDRNDVERVTSILARAGLPVSAPDLGVARYLELMGHDKKVEAGKLRFVLLKRLGKAIVSDSVEQTLLAELLSERPSTV